jgi:capsular exopolysaccharide synthesis family protein
MSLIFDALQRSESERSGAKVSALSAATEVLRLAELQVEAERKSAAKREPEATAGSWERNKVAAMEPAPPDGSVIGVEGIAALPMNGAAEYHAAFPQFESLKCVIPLENRLVCLTDNNSLAAEKFRFLGVSLQHLQRERQLKKMLITSTIPQEGKSMVSANLACTLSRRSQKRILLVEGDVRRPSLSHLFGLEKVVGLCECLQGDGDLVKSVHHLAEPGVWFLPAGSAPANPLELLQSGKLSVMMDQLSDWFDWIIIDSPPVMPLADTSVWMRLADGILMVVRQGVTEKRQLERGLEAIDPKKLIGSLLNGSRRRTSSDYYYAKVPS